MEMNKTAKEVKDWRIKKGFYTPSSISSKTTSCWNVTDADMMLSKLMLVVTEVAEAAEAVRLGNEENFAEELADSIIRIFDICATTGIDVEEAVFKKMGKNAN